MLSAGMAGESLGERSGRSHPTTSAADASQSFRIPFNVTSSFVEEAT
jgi:hypothetical protein